MTEMTPVGERSRSALCDPRKLIYTGEQIPMQYKIVLATGTQSGDELSGKVMSSLSL